MKKLEIRNYALKAAGGLSEPKASCSLLLSAFSIVPDFLVFAATEPWSRSHPHTRAEYVFDKKQPSPTSRNIPQGKPFRQKKPSPSWQNSITREAQLAAPNRTATPLPEVHATFRLTKLPVPPSKLPFHPTFEILHLPAGTFRLEQNQKTAKRLFRKPFSTGVWVSEVTAEGLEKT